MKRSDAATVKDVAAMAGVSIATVSRVAAGSSKVNPDTRIRVKRAVQELGYQPNHMGQGLRTQRSSNLGIVLPGFDNPFFLGLIANAVEFATEHGFRILVSGSPTPELDASKLAAQGIVDGLIFSAAADSSQRQELLNEVQVPLVSFDRRPVGSSALLIQVDNNHGATAMVQHLIESGAEKIAHIAGPSQLQVAQERQSAYVAILEANELPQNSDWIVPGDFSEESGRVAMKELLKLPSPPDAVFAANDLMAVGALRAIHEHGLTVPADIQLTGFDGTPASKYSTPGITTYVQPIAEMAKLCVAHLIEMIKLPEKVQPKDQLLIKGKMEIRGSTRTMVKE